MVDRTVKHIDVGEEIPDSLTWRSAELHELPTDSVLVTSKPPSGMYKVVALYVNPNTGKFVVRYDDTPIT